MMIAILLPAKGFANNGSDEALYQRLSEIGTGKGDSSLFDILNNNSRNLDWDRADETEFVGNLRIIKIISEETAGNEARIYLLRKLSGELYILSLPEDPSTRAKDANSPYAGLDEISGNKMVFNVKTMQATIDDDVYKFVKLIAGPEQMKLDRIFKISIILMLFFVMVGMGMTLTFKEFALVFIKPRGIILGEILQFGFMPFLAMCLGRLLGFYDQVSVCLRRNDPDYDNSQRRYFESDDLLCQRGSSSFHLANLFFHSHVHCLYTAFAGPVLC